VHSAAWVQPRPLGFSAVHVPPSQYGRLPAITQSASLAHAPRQSVPAHPCAHDTVATAPQAPMPSQTAARVFTPPAQLWARQLVDAAGYAHRERRPPSHAPPQMPAPAHAARLPCGCCADGTGVQVPRCA